MCKKTFPSRNSMFQHLTERHQFYQENQHKSESMEEESKKQFSSYLRRIKPCSVATCRHLVTDAQRLQCFKIQRSIRNQNIVK